VAARRTSSFRVLWRTCVAVAATAFACLVYTWATLPDVRSLRARPPDRTAFMRLREAEARAAGRRHRELWHWVAYRQISPNLKRAVLVAEDAGFWAHDGIDLAELQASLEINWNRRSFVRGASTITQQLAKNLYLSPSRNPYRKLTELLITRRLEVELSKERIFELYLNVIEWGDGIWGAEAAARAYFGRPASTLSQVQAALLAGAIINPRLYSPAQPNARLLARQRLILQRMGSPAPASPPALQDAVDKPTIVEDVASPAGDEPVTAETSTAGR
jgi:monofunctional biosynthetic peptidoglycan transglycosylase